MTQSGSPPVLMAASEVIAPAAQPAPPPPMPPGLKFVGVLALLQGLLLTASCGVVDGFAIFGKYPLSATAMDGVRIVAGVTLGVAAMLAVVLLLGGLLLSLGKRSGRIWLLLYVWSVLPLMLGGVVVWSILSADIEDVSPWPMRFFWFHAATASAAIAFGVVLGFMLLSGRVGDWYDRTRRGWKPVDPSAGPPRQHVLALLSLIFSFVPPYVLMQVVAVAMGVGSLGAIRRSGGRFRGRGMAIAGIAVSLSLILIATLAVGAFSVFAAGKERQSSSDSDDVIEARLTELDLAQRLFAQMDLDHDGKSNPCDTSLTELLKDQQQIAAVNDADALAAADRGKLGDRARPYHRYYFKLVRWRDDLAGMTDADDSRSYAIIAYPATDRSKYGPTFILWSDGTATRLAYTHRSEPPDEITATDADYNRTGSSWSVR